MKKRILAIMMILSMLVGLSSCSAGGQKQSVAIARSICLNPEVLLTNPEKDQALMEQMDLSGVTTVGEHAVTVTTGIPRQPASLRCRIPPLRS